METVCTKDFEFLLKKVPERERDIGYIGPQTQWKTLGPILVAILILEPISMTCPFEWEAKGINDGGFGALEEAAWKQVTISQELWLPRAPLKTKGIITSRHMAWEL